MCPQQFKRLQPVRAAAYDSARRQSCFGDTRAQLLLGIQSWMNDQGGKPIYILYGIAGIGKSTVAKTVAERAANDGTLGASFFFSRDEDNRKSAKSFFNTLAYHLAYHYPMFAERINVALEEDPELVERDPIQQFNRLIAKPLQTPIGGENPILLVIDALDECEENDAETILSLFAHKAPQIGQFRIFITARPERHIRSIFTHYRNHNQFHLHDIDQSIVEADIRAYLEFRLSREQVCKALPDLLPPIWQPTTEQMDALVGISGKLFIVAATAASFILDGKHVDPAKRLAVLLRGVSDVDFYGSKHTTAMDKVYMGIIRAAQPDPINDWTTHFQTCIGTIVLLHDPLPCDALAQLIGIDIGTILRTLSNLHSLLAPSAETRTFRVHHKSFPDFISDLDRCIPPFCIDRTVHNFRIAIRCLHIMDHFLTQNLCGLEPNEWHMDQAQILHRTQHEVSPHLAYSCTHWASHLTAALSGGAELDSEVKELLERFASKHIVTWLEALSIIGRMDTAYTSLDVVRTIRQWSHFPEIVQELFNDGCRFIQRSPGVLHSFPMQIYDSVLTFAPRNTALFRTHGGLHTRNVDVIAGSETDWNPVLAVLKGHTKTVSCVTFTADGLRLASASWDHMIRLWDGRTGHEITTLAGHTESVNSVSFSPDNSRLASASTDRTVRLWDSRMGHHVVTLAGHSGSVYSVTFSADGLRLASASEDKTVRLWDGRTGRLITILRSHDRVSSVTFSPDGSTLAYASDEHTIRLWDSETGHHFATMTGHTLWVNCVAFSPDGLTLASASNDNTVRLWDARTRCCITTLKGHSNWVTSVSFSTDGSRLVSGSRDRTVRLWDGRTGVQIADLNGHSDWVRSVTFSPDGSRLASASHDTVRMWDSRANSHVGIPKRHYGPISCVTFSPDGSKFALADDNMIQLWDGATGIHIVTLRGVSHPVSTVTFSMDGSKLASTSGGRAVQLWDVGSGCTIVVLGGHSHSINSVTFSADGSQLASMSDDGTVRLWDTGTGRCIAILSGHLASVTSAAFSSDGLRLASASGDKACLWDSRTGTHIASLYGHSHSINAVKFSADGTIFASASWDRTVRLWDGKTGGRIATLDGHFGEVEFITFSADGSRLISGSFNIRGSPEIFHIFDNTVLIWDITDITRPHVLYEKTAAGAFYLGAQNILFLLETRREPTLCGLTVLNLDSPSTTHPICWFPPDISPRRLVVHPAGLTAAVICADGRFLFLDISKVPIS